MYPPLIKLPNGEHMIHFTSYFDNICNLPKGLQLFSIARLLPENFRGESILDVAPSKDLLWQYKSDLIDRSDYAKVYLNFLDRNKDRIISRIAAEVGEVQSCFLCYEMPYRFCHRHLLSEWLNRNSSLTFMEFRSEHGG